MKEPPVEKKKGATPEEMLPGNLQLNKQRKKDFKREKKQRKRAGKQWVAEP